MPDPDDRNVTTRPRPDRARILLGVSACLVGEKVRYDGTDKRDPYLMQTLARYVVFVPLCPEVAIGLGVPRPPIRLVGDPQKPRVLGVDKPALDVTEDIGDFGRRVAAQHAGISGYVFKSRSPSCGVWNVPVKYGRGSRTGRGVYAASVIAARPLLPIEEETGLEDAARRDSFLERVFAYRRWQEFLSHRPTPARLSEFHGAHELVLMAHGESRRRSLGRLVARAARGSIGTLARAYGMRFMAALAVPATRGGHAHALRHAADALKKLLDPADRAELSGAIAAYRHGRLPWIAPVILLRHHLRRHPDPWLAKQAYLDPSPAELLLRSFG